MITKTPDERELFMAFVAATAKELGRKPWFVAAKLENGEVVSASSMNTESQEDFLKHLLTSFEHGPQWESTKAINLKEPKS